MPKAAAAAVVAVLAGAPAEEPAAEGLPLAQQLAQDGRFRVSEFALPDISAFAVWNQVRANDALHQWMLRIVIDGGVAISADSKCSRSDIAHEKE